MIQELIKTTEGKEIMANRIYVGNLSYNTTQETLSGLFGNYGEVSSATLIIDRDTQQSKGFGFVEFVEDSCAEAAIAALDGKELDGRRIRVNVAEERRPRDNDRGPRRFSDRGGDRPRREGVYCGDRGNRGDFNRKRNGGGGRFSHDDDSRKSDY